MSTFQLILLAVGLGLYLDFVAELLWLATGSYHYGGVPGPKIFSGHYYQFPLIENLLWGIAWGSYALLRYFKNDKGESICERGIEEVRLGRKGKAWVRQLAIFGGASSILLAFNLAYVFPAIHGDRWPDDILRRSYFTQGLCGEGTERYCSDPDVPIWKRGNVSITPDGQISDPAKLPKVVPLKKCLDSPDSAPLSGNC
jgi:hypothetical protein